MKKLICVLVITGFMASCTTKAPHYKITGKIKGANNVTFVLQKRVADKIVNLDSALVKNGSFKMKGGAVEYPDMVALIVRDHKIRTSFYLENSEIKITGRLDSLYNAKITGSKTQDEYSSYVASMKVLSEKYSSNYNEYQAAVQVGNQARVAEFEKLIGIIEGPDENPPERFCKK